MVARNLIGGEYGLRSRLGWTEYAVGLDGPVRSILPFTGSAASGANDRLFVTTETGIWNVSGGGYTAPTLLTADHTDGGGTNRWGAGYYFTVSAIFIDPISSFTNTGVGHRSNVLEATGSTAEGVLTLTWTEVQGATGYRVWHTNAAGTAIIGHRDVTGGGTLSYSWTDAVVTGLPSSFPTINEVTQVYTFGTASASSGFGVSTVVVNAAGNHFLAYCDEENGYILYEEDGAVWNAGGPTGAEVTGVTAGKLVHVMSWKNRLWFTEYETGSAWYLDVGALGGAATEFVFGTRFKAGGTLVGLWSWTYDGGSGIDDSLVAVSSGGDVLVYRGTDPNVLGAFALSGVWQIGRPPKGRRIATEDGGDLLLMSSLGILSMSKLVNGASSFDRTQYETTKVANLFGQVYASANTVDGWAMHIHPEDACLMVWTPAGTATESGQLVMSIATKGWSQYSGLPAGLCAGAWGGLLYFGTDDGRVCINTGYVDGVLLSDSSAATAIDWTLITAFTTLGSPVQKRLQNIRTRILCQGGEVPLTVEARYGFDLSEPDAPQSVTTSGTNTWDSALWDQATFSGGYAPQSRLFGAFGCGSEVALAVRGQTKARMTLVGMDVSFTVGGMR